MQAVIKNNQKTILADAFSLNNLEPTTETKFLAII